MIFSSSNIKHLRKHGVGTGHKRPYNRALKRTGCSGRLRPPTKQKMLQTEGDANAPGGHRTYAPAHWPAQMGGCGAGHSIAPVHNPTCFPAPRGRQHMHHRPAANQCIIPTTIMIGIMHRFATVRVVVSPLYNPSD